MNVLIEDKVGHGGKRARSGRPSKYKTNMVATITLRATQEQYDKFCRLGGCDWLREIIENAEEEHAH